MAVSGPESGLPILESQRSRGSGEIRPLNGQKGKTMSEPPKPTKPFLNTCLRPDCATMEVNIIGSEGQRIAGVFLTAPQLDKVMAGLADIRSKMTPEVPHTFPVGEPTHQHHGTKYAFGIDPFSGNVCVSFRSPGFGWLTYYLPPEELEKMHTSPQRAKGGIPPLHSDTKQ